MRALLFDGKVRFDAEYPGPEAGEGEALVRVTRAGICATDLEIVKGYMGYTGVLGHEFTGVVEGCADPGLVGKRVVGEINIGCGRCRWCEKGLSNHCPNRVVLGILDHDGAFADYVTLPAGNLHVVPDSVSDDEAVFAEPLAAAFEITRQVDVGPGIRVAVVGAGRLGLLIAQVLASTGCELTVVGRRPERLAMLEGRDVRLVTPEGTEPIGGFDVVVDSTGSVEGFGVCLGLVRPLGTLVLKTTVAGETGVDMSRIVVNEINVVGSRCGPFGPALEALKDGTVDVGPLVSARFPLERGVEAMEYAARKGVLKVLLDVAP